MCYTDTYMCEQCNAATVLYTDQTESDKDSFLNEWYLVRATRDGTEMKKDDWGLVVCNDPDFWFKTTPWLCPYYHLSEAEQDNLPEEDLAELVRWESAAGEFGDELLACMNQHGRSLHNIAQFAMKLQRKGWDPDDSLPARGNIGSRLECWMFQKLAEYMFTHSTPISTEPHTG